MSTYNIFRSHPNPPPEVVVTDTAETVVMERKESSHQVTTTTESTITKTITEVMLLSVIHYFTEIVILHYNILHCYIFLHLHFTFRYRKSLSNSHPP